MSKKLSNIYRKFSYAVKVYRYFAKVQILMTSAPGLAEMLKIFKLLEEIIENEVNYSSRYYVFLDEILDVLVSFPQKSFFSQFPVLFQNFRKLLRKSFINIRWYHTRLKKAREIWANDHYRHLLQSSSSAFSSFPNPNKICMKFISCAVAAHMRSLRARTDKRKEHPQTLEGSN